MINKIINANCYLDGNTLIGKMDEIALPSIKLKMEDYNALGLFAQIELPAGLEKMEAKLKWNSVYGDNFKAESVINSVTITVKSNMVQHGAGGVVKNVPVTATITGVFKELPMGTIKGAAKVDGMEHTMAVYYCKLEENGSLVFEVDVFNNIFKIGSTDVLSEFRLNQ